MSRPARRSLLGSIAYRSARHMPIVVVAWVALLSTGGYAYLRGLPQEGFPVVNLPFVSMQATYLVDDPARVDTEIAVPLTEVFLEAEGVTTVFTRSTGDAMTGFVDFDESMTSVEGVAVLQSVVPELPPGATVEFSPIEPTKYLNRFDVLVSVVADRPLDPTDLQAAAEQVAASISDAPAVGAAEIVPNFRTGTDPATGAVTTRQTSFSRVALDPADGFDASVLIGVSAAEGVDAIEVRNAVAVVVADSDRPDGVDATVTAALADGIDEQRGQLEGNLIEGLLAVSLVGLVVIGWRAAVVTAVFMVTTLGTTLGLLWALGYSLNTITLFALILTLGLLVDDAIVIAEAIDAHHDDDRPRVDIVRDAVGSVGLASVAGTFTTALVFCPMLFVSGVLGQFIRVMPITVIITLLASLALSITMVSAAGRAFLLGGTRRVSPSGAAIRWLGQGAAGLVRVGSRPTLAGVVVAMLAIYSSVAASVAGFVFIRGLDFDVFPASKDSNALVVDVSVDGGGTSVADVEAATRPVDDVLVDELGSDLVRALYVGGSSRGAVVFVDLVPHGDRAATAPELVDRLQARFADLDGLRVSVNQVDPAPPPSDYPFAVQIDASGDPDAAEVLATDLADRLRGERLVRPNGREARIVDAIVSTGASITRDDGRRYVEVRARFDGDDTSGLLELAEDRTRELVPSEELADRGLTDALRFDFGQETENAEGFASAVRALWLALGAMLVLLAIQFRSVVQPLLIVSAIPFATLGVGLGLRSTNNALSFFVMIGLIGLIGVVVNNTILLVDAANKERAKGASPSDAVAHALARRFRPLVATTATSVVGLAPLALTDPFWEPMAVTIMFGLISSTTFVIVAFPFYYIVVETARGAVLRRVGRGARAQASISTTVTDSAPPGA